MRSRSRTARSLRRRSLAGYYLPDSVDWKRLVDKLSMHLCSASEWQAYDKQRREQARQAQQKPLKGATIYVFPIWCKYRQQARKIACLQSFAPVLRYLPLPVSSFLGRMFF
ncbi:hypothetical protein [Vampirovibrio sp.]|uniref:hypothetical protein n=1 Tax=Vampirovibrio sp. TaxID=2717857 RepID=UPI0035941C1B